jgi:hypothetical protein
VVVGLLVWWSGMWLAVWGKRLDLLPRTRLRKSGWSHPGTWETTSHSQKAGIRLPPRRYRPNHALEVVCQDTTRENMTATRQRPLRPLSSATDLTDYTDITHSTLEPDVRRGQFPASRLRHDG